MSQLQNRYPTIFSKLEEDISELRELVVIDENYADIDDEEVDVFDPNDYNYLVYITENLSSVLGEDGLKKLYTKLDSSKVFDEFLASEEDLYGVMSQKSEEDVAYTILDIVEDILKEEK
jgi:hypothetical protein